MTAVAPALVVGRLVELRRPEVGDAAVMAQAINESIEHLSPWMPWAQAPTRIADQAVRMAMAAEAFESGGEVTYTLFDRASGAVAGGAGINSRPGRAVRDIGYWLHPRFTARGLVTEAAALLTRVAFEVLDLDRVDIRCDVANVRSAAVARRLGYEHVGTIVEERDAPADTGRTMVWTMTRDSFAGSPADDLSAGCL